MHGWLTVDWCHGNVATETCQFFKMFRWNLVWNILYFVVHQRMYLDTQRRTSDLKPVNIQQFLIVNLIINRQLNQSIVLLASLWSNEIDRFQQVNMEVTADIIVISNAIWKLQHLSYCGKSNGDAMLQLVSDTPTSCHINFTGYQYRVRQTFNSAT